MGNFQPSRQPSIHRVGNSRHRDRGSQPPVQCLTPPRPRRQRRLNPKAYTFVSCRVVAFAHGKGNRRGHIEKSQLPLPLQNSIERSTQLTRHAGLARSTLPAVSLRTTPMDNKTMWSLKSSIITESGDSMASAGVWHCPLEESQVSAYRAAALLDTLLKTLADSLTLGWDRKLSFSACAGWRFGSSKHLWERLTYLSLPLLCHTWYQNSHAWTLQETRLADRIFLLLPLQTSCQSLSNTGLVFPLSFR
ncbi:hypothetical protein CSPX01_07402 [Colletotrichum filicis]|nr:hypothetical protein CSPX01_07402 [Colletotrichum filicis]